LQTLSDLLDLVPNELARVLSRLAGFWEKVACLTDRTIIYEDTKSIEKYAGIWPSRCDVDRKIFKVLKKSTFRTIPKKQKDTILKFIEDFDYRVPTMGLVISEASFFLNIAKGICEKLKSDGDGFRLQYSETRKGSKTVLGEAAYFRNFLQSAQHVSYSMVNRHASPAHSIQERTTNCRRVTNSANFWINGTPSEIFDEKALRSTWPYRVKDQMPVCLLVKGFLESFLGSSVLGNHCHMVSRRQINRPSETTPVGNVVRSQDSSAWTIRASDHDSQFIIEPFMVE